MPARNSRIVKGRVYEKCQGGDMDNLSAVLHKTGDLRMEQRPVPECGEEEVLVRVHTVGICGSDVHYWTHGAIGSFIVREPMVVGHETSGTVVKTGASVKHLKEGDRVAMEPGLPCGGCEQCKTGHYNLCPAMRFFATPPIHGTLTRFVAHNANFCYKLPSNVSFEEGALLEPLSVAVHTCRRAGISIGQKVLVTGAGPIGVLTMMTANAMGAGRVVVTDIDEGRLALAKKLGATQTICVKDKELSTICSSIVDGLGGQPDATAECTGAQPCIETAIQTTRSGGCIVLVGLGAARVELPIIEAATREIDIRGIFRYANCYPIALELVASGKIDLSGLTRAHYKLEDTIEAFKRSQVADVVKVFIECEKTD